MSTSGGDAKLFARVSAFQFFSIVSLSGRRACSLLSTVDPLVYIMESLTFMSAPNLHFGSKILRVDFSFIKMEAIKYYITKEIPSNMKDTYRPFIPADRPPRPKGKVAELRQELNSGGKKDKNNSAKKIALKKIVANMTMSNNDMVALFPDVVGCMQIPSLEIKKMYVVRYSNRRR